MPGGAQRGEAASKGRLSDEVLLWHIRWIDPVESLDESVALANCHSLYLRLLLRFILHGTLDTVTVETERPAGLGPTACCML